MCIESRGAQIREGPILVWAYFLPSFMGKIIVLLQNQQIIRSKSSFFSESIIILQIKIQSAKSE
jgi:hypothetical protein